MELKKDTDELVEYFCDRLL